MAIAEKGFTLIELMIVVAIISILAALAIPAYQDYVARAQVTEGISLATGAKVALATYYADTGKFPANNVIAGMAHSSSIKGRYVDSLVVDDTGLIAVTFSAMANANIRGDTLTLSAANQSGSLSWTCGGIDAKYLPSSCR